MCGNILSRVFVRGVDYATHFLLREFTLKKRIYYIHINTFIRRKFMEKSTESLEKLKNTISQNLINCRKSKNQTQAEFAEYCGISLYRLKKLESGQLNISLKVLMIIAKQLGCTAANLVTDKYFQ